MADPKHTLHDASGAALPGYLNDSAGPSAPALLVNHEWWGLNAQIQKMADRLAQAGFVTFVPDLYRGHRPQSTEEADKAMKALSWEQAGQDLKRATEALRKDDPTRKVGILGFCMGGALSLFAASQQPELSACVPFYGIPSDADLGKIRAKVQGHYAKIDDWCTPDRVDALERELREKGVDFELLRYDAKHAFCNEARPEVYSKEHAELALGRATEFLKKTLGA